MRVRGVVGAAGLDMVSVGVDCLYCLEKSVKLSVCSSSYVCPQSFNVSAGKENAVSIDKLGDTKLIQ